MIHPVRQIVRGASLSDTLEEHFEQWVAAQGDTVPREIWQRALRDPAVAFLDRPSKQFRARLVTTAWMLASGDLGNMPHQLPMIVEILHAGSMIVDDIQDGSTRRRGSPALHRQIGTPLAINTGNLLYCWALDLLGSLGLPPAIALELYRRTSRAMLLCHQGQALDLSVNVYDAEREDLPGIVLASTSLKAGTLMELAASLGAVAAGGGDRTVSALAAFGRELGTALQMLDDLGGILSDRRGQKACEDLRLGRPTWVWAMAADDLDPVVFGALRAKALSAASSDVIGALRELLHESGPRRVHCRLQRTLDDLQLRLGSSAPLAALKQEIERLESSYV